MTEAKRKKEESKAKILRVRVALLICDLVRVGSSTTRVRSLSWLPSRVVIGSGAVATGDRVETGETAEVSVAYAYDGAGAYAGPVMSDAWSTLSATSRELLKVGY